MVWTLQDPIARSDLARQLGSWLAITAVILFSFTLLPGILQRLRWLPQLTIPVSTIITPFRRHIGILMFLTAWMHMALSGYLQTYILTGSPIPPAGPRLFEFFGFLGWLLLLPVWLTSNDTSMRFLGKKWKALQRLTYIALWFIMSHVGLQGNALALLLLVIGVLEVTSWVVAKRRQPIR
jgi:DMSO/TMAO reductase YedYZ heme-binding membrane subunit